MKNLIVHTDNLNLKAIGRPDIYLKMECNQFSNSFKSRGIVCYLDHIEKINGLVTFTTGNHGIAVAAIAKEIGVEAIIISNAWISDYKKGIIEGLGAKIELINHNNLLDSTEYGKKIAANLGYSFVPLYDNEYLLKGYSGIAKEIVNDFGHQTITYFPIGSGSLLLSNSKYLKSLHNVTKIIGVEPKIYQRLNSSCIIGSKQKSIADSLSIDKIPLENLDLLEYTDSIEAINENDIIIATKIIYDQFNIITEPGGAITLAAVLNSAKNEIKKIAVITGKNISDEAFHSNLKKIRQTAWQK